MTTRSITLRSTSDGQGSRHLWAKLSADGTLTIEGQDLGAGVEQFFGYSEYEWARTIRPQDVRKLAVALDAGGDVLAALAKRYKDDSSFILESFLDANGIHYESWSRIGD